MVLELLNGAQLYKSHNEALSDLVLLANINTTFTRLRDLLARSGMILTNACPLSDVCGVISTPRM